MPFVVIVGSVLMTVPLVITYGLGDVIADAGPNLLVLPPPLLLLLPGVALAATLVLITSTRSFVPGGLDGLDGRPNCPAWCSSCTAGIKSAFVSVRRLVLNFDVYSTKPH